MHPSVILGTFTLATAASASVLIPRDDRSKDGIWTTKGKVTDLPAKRSVPIAVRDDRSKDGIWTASGQLANLPTKRSAQVEDGGDLQIQARWEYDNCDRTVSGPLAVDADYQREAQNGLRNYCTQNPADCNQTIWSKAGDVVVFFCLYHSPNKFDAGQFDYSMSKIAGVCREGFAGNMDGGTYAYGVTRSTLHGWCGFDANYEP